MSPRLSQGIELVNKDDAGGPVLGPPKEVSYARRSYTDKHFP
jgi:hypothetical protein